MWKLTKGIDTIRRNMTTNVPVNCFFFFYIFLLLFFYSKVVTIWIVAMTLRRKVHSRLLLKKIELYEPQAAQTLFLIYIRDSIALPFQPFKRMYENGSKIALNSTCSKGLNERSLP